MLAGQKGYGANGLQNYLFPLDDMFLTQGSYTATASHNGSYAMDFQGWKNGARVLHCPYYAPFDCTLVARWGANSPQLVWQSNNPVNFVDGTVDYACIAFNHDDDVMSYTIGETRQQGDVIGHTGTYGGASGDIVHIEGKKGVWQGYHQNSQGVYMLTNSTWLYDLMGVNDTVLTKTYYINHNNVRVDYPWNTFAINLPYPQTKSKFPWVLYARKLREKR